MPRVNSALLAERYQKSRRDLLCYVTRLVVRPEIAEELVQQSALKLLEAETVPVDSEGVRAWLFRIATNLAIDHIRRHSTWRENVLLETRTRAEANEAFVAESQLLRGSPEMSAIAREHLAVCFACTLRNTPPQQAAALLLAEVYGFTVQEVAEMLGASGVQAKNWIQSARAALREKYEQTCALVTKRGVCYQCTELSEFFTTRNEDPLDGTDRDIDARLAILRQQQDALGPWHRVLMRIINDVLGDEPLKRLDNLAVRER